MGKPDTRKRTGGVPGHAPAEDTAAPKGCLEVHVFLPCRTLGEGAALLGRLAGDIGAAYGGLTGSESGSTRTRTLRKWRFTDPEQERKSLGRAGPV